MKIVYVSEKSIKESIDYFCSLKIDSPEQLGMFFFFKSIGFNELEYELFPKVSGISEEQRKEYLSIMYNLSAVFDKSVESGEKKSCLFPFSITNEIGSRQQFNPGTVFKGLLSRMRDTVDNTLVDDTKFLRKDDSNPDCFKFPRDYIQILQRNFLNHKRISLVYLAAWYFRFRGVECNDFWLEDPSKDSFKAFTRVCVKVLVDELKLTENELSELFYNDEDEVITYSAYKISGSSLRGKLNFRSESVPEINVILKGGNDYMSETRDIEIQRTEELSQPSGNNITVNNLRSLLNASKQVILYGAPGTSKSHITNQINYDFEDSTMVQFHASLTYEQFIGGISVDQEGRFISKPGIFLDFCERARKYESTGKKYLFIIDEINRSNVSKVFGETILTLDREYTADLVAPINWEGSSITKFSIPSNVFIIATMNSADRSIAQIDYAIRRRFAFVKFYPNYELIDNISDCSSLQDIKPSVLLKSINKSIFNVLKDENMLLGHAYFLPKWAMGEDGKIHWTPEVLKVLFNYYVLPIIEEYTYGNSRYLANILGNAISERIEDNSLFISEIQKQFKVR